MPAISEEPSRMSIKKYLEWELHQDLRHEYMNSEIFTMQGGTIPNNAAQIAAQFKNGNHHKKPIAENLE